MFQNPTFVQLLLSTTKKDANFSLTKFNNITILVEKYHVKIASCKKKNFRYVTTHQPESTSSGSSTLQYKTPG